MRVGFVAATSALAAAWFYRKTLARLQQAEHAAPEASSVAPADDEF
jgi:hypothetical protein